MIQRRKSAGALAALTAAAFLGSVGAVSPALATSPPDSSTFATVSVGENSSIQSASNGDLWPSCWSGDGNLYAANGDGTGFSTNGSSSDVAVSRIAGGPANLSGSTVAIGNAISQVWTAGNYNRKPTGMVCVGGAIYLAVQDLSTSFNDAPAATIVKSTDGGQTWTWNHSAPMFSNHVFTTVFFADYGQNNVNSPDRYVYAYGLDNNWRTSYTGTVPNPTDLYLARVPASSIQTLSTWQYYAGTTGGSPVWSSNISSRQAVLHDDRVLYPNVTNGIAHNLTPLAQGGVLYDKPLNRYIYSSWTEYTYEFYDSPTPYGPWTHFLTKDFGGYPWTQAKNGGYATTIPSKFLSTDGKSMYIQSNVCSCGGAGTAVYEFALRPLTLTLASTNTASNPVSSTTNLAQAAGTVPVERVAHFGNNSYYADGNLQNSEDDWNSEVKSTDASWWGYTWPQKYTLSSVTYTTGTMYIDGGWFASNLRVQVRNNGVWTDVTGQSNPGYPYSSAAGSNTSYTFAFAPVAGDGVRVIGRPGGSSTFTSIGELSAYNSSSGGTGSGFTVGGAIATEYNSLGGSSGFLGQPTTNETATGDGTGRYNNFQNDGSIYWTPSTGAHEVHGAIRDEWASIGLQASPVGYPTGDQTVTADGVGRFNNFQNGVIYWTPATGAHEIQGVILNKWIALSRESGVLGYPTSDELADPVGRRSNFQNGYVVWNSSTGVATAFHSNGTVI
jgi:uncharacterized protein with LGFP repeats